MAKDDHRDIWFPRKKYGLGWGLPVTRPGWVFFISWALATVSGCYFFQATGQVPQLMAFILLMTAILLMVCYLKGEKPGPH